MAISIIEIAWLAGLVEGEGCLFITPKNSPTVSVAMTDRDVVEHASRLLHSTMRVTKMDRRSPHWKPIYITRLHSSPAVAWMMTIYGLLGERRKAKIRTIIAQWRRCKSKIYRGTHCAKGHEMGVYVLGQPRKCKQCAREYAIRNRPHYRMLERKYRLANLEKCRAKGRLGQQRLRDRRKAGKPVDTDARLF